MLFLGQERARPSAQQAGLHLRHVSVQRDLRVLKRLFMRKPLTALPPVCLENISSSSVAPSRSLIMPNLCTRRRAKSTCRSSRRAALCLDMVVRLGTSTWRMFCPATALEHVLHLPPEGRDRIRVQGDLLLQLPNHLKSITNHTRTISVQTKQFQGDGRLTDVQGWGCLVGIWDL
jgi:hypothetical protein